MLLQPLFGAPMPGADVARRTYRAYAMNSAPNSQPIRQTSRHWRGRPSEKMSVNSGGISTCSATTLTPPSEMSVTTQSRGNEPFAD